ncbi:hypothetical protein S40293_08821 [Stachybotrys chartarum IBT 40293]|nr:hypothetical protein S40293_08821 [Stachybotrys chartarum IBT 40293]
MPSPSLELDGESPLVDSSAGTIHHLPWHVGIGVEEVPQLQFQLQLQHPYQLQLQHQHQHQPQYQAQHQYSSPSSYPTWSSPATPAETTVDTPQQFQTPAALPCNSTGYFPQQAYAQLQQDQQGTYRTVEDHPSNHQHLQNHQNQQHQQHQHHQHQQQRRRRQQQQQQQQQHHYHQELPEHTGNQGAIPQQTLEPHPKMPTRKRSGPGPTLDVSDKQPKTASSPRRQRRQTQQQPQKSASQTQQKQPRQQKADEAKPKKRGRKPKYVTVDPSPPASDDEELQGLDDDGASLPDGPQRTHVLERNRVAATKCRLRKRDEASALASREQTVEDQNRYLSSCFDSLVSEVLQLKTELLRHTDCGCVLIQRYIAHEAKKTVENMTGVSEQSSQWSDPFTTSSRGSVDYSNISPTNPEQGHEYYSLPWDQAPPAHGRPQQMEYYHACSKSQNQSVPSPAGLDPFHGPRMGTLAQDMPVT